jgi:hypothetical protein
MAFWITSRMKAKREQAYGDLLIIKLFASNYARDLLYKYDKKNYNAKRSTNLPDEVHIFNKGKLELTSFKNGNTISRATFEPV